MKKTLPRYYFLFKVKLLLFDIFTSVGNRQCYWYEQNDTSNQRFAPKINSNSEKQVCFTLKGLCNLRQLAYRFCYEMYPVRSVDRAGATCKSELS